MSRFTSTFLSLILVAGLVFAAGIGSFFKTSHALAAVGVQTIVICGSDGVEEISLDAGGNQVPTPSTQDCAHCADCSLVPHAVLSAFSPVQFQGATSQFLSDPLTAQLRPRTQVWHQSRGPPLQLKVS